MVNRINNKKRGWIHMKVTCTASEMIHWNQLRLIQAETPIKWIFKWFYTLLLLLLVLPYWRLERKIHVYYTLLSLELSVEKVADAAYLSVMMWDCARLYFPGYLKKNYYICTASQAQHFWWFVVTNFNSNYLL